MKKIGDVTSTADKNGEWTNGNVAAGIAPTILEAGWLNSVQREILGVLVEAGIAQDKNNDNQLKDAIKKIISNWNYATPEDLKKYLAKAQNGADIPDTEAFIKNLGLEERLNKKFDKTGGTISGYVEIKSSGGALKLTSTTEGSSNYIEFYGADKRTAYIGYGSDLTTAFTIRNEKTGVTLRVSDAVTVDGYRVITTADTQIPVGGSVIWNSTAPIPDNFWPNEGRSFSAADYPELAKAFPSLKLPDDRGYAIRFADNGKGIDPGRTVGSYQEDAIRNIVGWFGERDFRSPNSDNYISFLWGHSGVFKSEKRMSSEGSSPVMEKASSGNWSGTRFDASLYVPTANENRMKNVAKILITRVK
ncbi:tail fiber protein [Morganella morganii]|uniref:tail fiber protein n=1 Tax=Morganella morganii TaxID=582 RepID=UPI00191CD810|nr:tail fiber protein [Morganella morganii]QQU42434.1 tail fiber protein [Morganella morganii]